ncbi:MAG: MFS transporter [Sphaerochaeta sp.]|nr:MFS transporter [Sphaerochaeta sp.]
MKKLLLRGIGGIIILAVVRAAAAAIPPLNNAYVRFLGVPAEIAPTISGTILALGYVFAVLGPLFAGYMADRAGSVKTFMFGGLIFVVFYALWAFTPIFQLLYLYRVILAVGSGLIFVGVQKYLLEGAPKGKKGMSMGFYGLGFGVGAAIGPMLGALIVPKFGIIRAYYVLSLASLIALVVGFLITQIATLLDKEPKAPTLKHKPTEKKPSFAQVFANQPKAVYVIIAIGVSIGINNAAVFANIDDLAVSLGWKVGAGTMGVAIFALFSFAMPLGGVFGDKLGAELGVLLGCVFLTIGFGALAVIGNPSLIYPLMAVAGIGSVLFTPNSQALIGSYASDNYKGTLLSYLQGAVGLGSAGGALLGGFLHSAISVRATFVSVLISGLLAVAISLILVDMKKKAPKPAEGQKS